MLLQLILISIIIVCLVLTAGYYNGKMDHIKEYQLDDNSWKNKWKWFDLSTDQPNKIDESLSIDGLFRKPFVSKWYYPFGLFAPQYIEAFPYSSTALSWLTDNWHKYKMLMFTCYEIIGGGLFLLLICAYYQSWLIMMCLPLVILFLKGLRGITFNIEHTVKK